MVDAYWGNVVSNYAQLFGLPPNAMLLIIAVCVSLGIAIGMYAQTKNKTVTMVTFFFILTLTAFLGWYNFIILFVVLVLVAMFIFYKGGFK